MLSFRALPLLGFTLAAGVLPENVAAQGPEYGIEAGAGIRYEAWDYAADLRPDVGPVARLGCSSP